MKSGMPEAFKIDGPATAGTTVEVTTLVITAAVSPCLAIPGARDVEVIVQIPGLDPIEGEVNLASRQYDGRLEAYSGWPDQWISGAFLRQLAQFEYAACDTAEEV